MNLPKQSLPLLPKHKSREIRKLEGERDRALERLLRFKKKKKQKKEKRQRQTMARQLVSLTVRHTQALIDGEI